MSNEVIHAGNKRVLKFNCGDCKYNPSLSHTPACRRDVIDSLNENANIDKIKLRSEYVREYKKEDVTCLSEFTQALEDSHYLVLKSITPTDCDDCEAERQEEIEEIWSRLRSEPRKGIVDLKQMIEEFKERTGRGSDECRACRSEFLREGLRPAIETLSDTKLLTKSGPGGGKRGGYEDVFSPASRPGFLRSKLKLQAPGGVELVNAYEIKGTKVRIYYSPEDLKYLYFVIPPEYKLPPIQIQILQEVKQELLKTQGSLSPALARSEIESRSRKLIMDVALERNVDLKNKEIDYLANSLAQFTAGLGILETFLSDRRVQDVYVDAPVGENPVHLYHRDFEECVTNALLSPEDAQVLISRFRAMSGRPFSEANPTLDLNLENVRIAAIQEPLSPEGLALALRRHKSTPWTLPQFIERDFLTPKAAGLLSLLVDSQASILITGSRGAGKTSLLGALMLELLPKYRILCLEDTAELPVEELRSLGYKAQRLQVRPSSSGSKLEMTAEEALRAALRLGESVLVIGEVRGPETRSLYEAMRVGAAGNSVMGTIHGSTTKDVFERVVYDLGIPPSSFKATDAIAVAAPIRSKGGVRRVRRLTQISEVGETWEENPLAEGGFTDLVFYNAEEDDLGYSPALEEGGSPLLESIARRWSMGVDELLENLEVRSKIQETLVETASSLEKPELFGPEFVVNSNLTFHRLLEEELRDGEVDYSRLFSRWRSWLNGASE